MTKVVFMRSSFWSKNKGGPGPLSWIRHSKQQFEERKVSFSSGLHIFVAGCSYQNNANPQTPMEREHLKETQHDALQGEFSIRQRTIASS